MKNLKQNLHFNTRVVFWLSFFIIVLVSIPASALWINEINYDDPLGDSNEFIEVVGPAGTDLSGYSIVLYNGSNGAVYGTNNLSGVLGDEGCGFGAISFSYPPNGIQNGEPDGLALVFNNTQVIQFLSYEGGMTAVGGPANGLAATQISAVDDPNNNVTLILTGTGDAYEDFAWQASTNFSPGLLNATQSIDPCGGGGPSTNVRFKVATASIGEAGGTFNITVLKSLDVGDVSGSITLGGTATEGAGNDYTVNTTNFTMNGATTSATITVTINDDTDLEPLETLVATITNVSGGTISAPFQLVLSITDNDASASPLFISEVVDPQNNSNARYIELYNNSEDDIDLESGPWYLSRQSNGGSTWGDIPLVGTIAAGSVYVVAANLDVHTVAYPLAPPPDLISNQINGNGNDGYFLYVAGSHVLGQLVDAYGAVNQDGSGQPWEYTDGRAVRVAGVTGATSIWTASEWIILRPNATTNATPGEHPEAAPTVVTNVHFAFASASIGESGGSYVVSMYKSVDSGTITGEIVVSGTAAIGDDFTINVTSFALNGATTSATFTVNIINDTEEEVAETIILTITNIVGGDLGSPSEFTLTILANDVPPPPGGVVWINEFLYNPPGVDSNEFIEIAGPAGTDLSVYEIYWYNGNGGVVYGTNLLSGIIDDEGCGLGAVSFDAVLQNGPDALALVSNGTTVVEFISYGSTFTASNGPASGLTSYDISVIADNTNTTVQLSGSGSSSIEFAWVVDVASRGLLNVTQSILPCIDGGGGPAEYNISDIILMNGSPGASVLTETGFVYSLQYITNLLDILPNWITVDSEAGTATTVILIDTNPANPHRVYRISAE